MAGDKKKAVTGLKALKVLGVALGVAVTASLALGAYVATHTQSVVGLIQAAMYGGASPNSFEPLHAPGEGVTEAGQYKINDISYGGEHPNSFLDITYPSAERDSGLPTLFYFHGGGFFGGSKDMGDPMAANEATALIDDLCAQGYNIVNVDYALVPDRLFPVPLVQANQAVEFICQHKDEYGLNMDDVVLMGSSAGAIMTAQYAAALSNPEYAQLLGIEPQLAPEQVRAVVVDDGPLDYRYTKLQCKLLIGNYVKGSVFLGEEELDRYECIPHMTPAYPPAVLLGSEYRSDMASMAERLGAEGVEHLLVDPLAEHGEERPHCFVANERTDPLAKEAFVRMLGFLEKQAG